MKLVNLHNLAEYCSIVLAKKIAGRIGTFQTYRAVVMRMCVDLAKSYIKSLRVILK